MKSISILFCLLFCLASCAEEDTTEMVELVTSSGHRFQIDVYEFPNKAGSEPTYSVDLADAQAACEKKGKRLCTSTEWRRACAGPEGARRYSYGDQYIPRICHTEVDKASGHSSMLDPAGLIVASGAYADCQTDAGIHDLNGTLEEWVLDSWRGIGGMLEGGAFYTHHEYTDCTGQYSRQPDYRLVADQPVSSAGFRCCVSETPPSEEDISADANTRIEAAQRLNSTAPYQTDNEVEISPGLFMDRFEYPNQAGEFPIRAIQWTEANEKCTAAGKRLCSAAEWEQACGGSQRNTMPYGEHYMAGACPVYLDAPTPSGSHPACASDLGVYDLVGGLWEWTSTPLDAEALRAQGLSFGDQSYWHKDPDSKGSQSQTESLREIRGGSWYVEEKKGLCRPDEGYPAAPEGVPFPDVGFRCCRGQAKKVPQPTSMSPESCPSGLVLSGGVCISEMEFPGERGTIPRGNLNWQDAQEQCQTQGLRVCTSTEWTRACEGAEERRWPYGDVYEPQRCFVLEDDASTETSARPSGSMADCASADGVFDMSGNLWEWTEDTNGQGVLRGGGWNFSAGMNQCRAQATPDLTTREAQFGVRCCTEPIPKR